MKGVQFLIILSACSSALGASALKAAALSSTKRKDPSSGLDSRPEKKKKSALEEIMEVEKMIFVFSMCVLSLHLSQLSVLKGTLSFVQMEEKKKKKQSVKTDYWLQPNIVVKVITKRLGEKYHKKKAVIMVTMLCIYSGLRVC